MKDYLISMFIDDELALDEKIEFVESVYAEEKFRDETIEYLQSEKELTLRVTDTIPPLSDMRRRGGARKVLRYAGIALASSVIVIAVALWHIPTHIEPVRDYRFVLYKPDASRAEIAGSFTGWLPLSMQNIGNTGYWELRVPLDAGEHKYTFILDGAKRYPDPTVLTRESDDFGGENSVLTTGESL